MYNRNQNSFKNCFWNELKRWPHKPKQHSNQTQMVSIMCVPVCGRHFHFSSSSLAFCCCSVIFLFIANDTNIYISKKKIQKSTYDEEEKKNNNKIDSKQNEAYLFDAVICNVIYSILALNLLFIILYHTIFRCEKKMFPHFVLSLSWFTLIDSNFVCENDLRIRNDVEFMLCMRVCVR